MNRLNYGWICIEKYKLRTSKKGIIGAVRTICVYLPAWFDIFILPLINVSLLQIYCWTSRFVMFHILFHQWWLFPICWKLSNLCRTLFWSILLQELVHCIDSFAILINSHVISVHAIYQIYLLWSNSGTLKLVHLYHQKGKVDLK